MDWKQLEIPFEEEEWMSSIDKHREDIKKVIRYLEDELANNLSDK